MAAVLALALPLGARGLETAPTMAPFDPAKAPPNAAISGGNGELLVRVTDPEGSTLSGVTVALQQRSNSTETDENGLVLLKDLTPGVGYEIFVIAEAYPEWTDVYTYPRERGETEILTVSLGSPEGAAATAALSGTEAEEPTTPPTAPQGGTNRWLLAAFLILVALVSLLCWKLYRSWHEGEPWQPPQEPDAPGEVIDIDWEAVEENGTENE